MNYRFKPDSKGEVVEIGNGERVLRFERSKQPFDVSEKDVRLLKGVDDLEPVPEVPPQQDQSQSDEQSSQSDSSASTDGQQGETSSANPPTQPAARRRSRSSQTAD